MKKRRLKKWVRVTLAFIITVGVLLVSLIAMENNARNWDKKYYNEVSYEY